MTLSIDPVIIATQWVLWGGIFAVATVCWVELKMIGRFSSKEKAAMFALLWIVAPLNVIGLAFAICYQLHKVPKVLKGWVVALVSVKRKLLPNKLKMPMAKVR